MVWTKSLLCTILNSHTLSFFPQLLILFSLFTLSSSFLDSSWDYSIWQTKWKIPSVLQKCYAICSHTLACKLYYVLLILYVCFLFRVWDNQLKSLLHCLWTRSGTVWCCSELSHKSHTNSSFHIYLLSPQDLIVLLITHLEEKEHFTMPLEQSELMSQEFLFTTNSRVFSHWGSFSFSKYWQIKHGKYTMFLFFLIWQPKTQPFLGGVDITNIYLTRGWHSFKILLI